MQEKAADRRERERERERELLVWSGGEGKVRWLPWMVVSLVAGGFAQRRAQRGRGYHVRIYRSLKS